MPLSHRVHFVCYLAILFATVTGALAQEPMMLGPVEPAPPPGHIAPFSPGLIDATIQRSEEEFKAYVLEHTHEHTHVEFEKRFTRLEVRINEVIELCNKMMPMLLGNIQQGVDVSAQVGAIGVKVKKTEQAVVELGSKYVPTLRRFDKREKELECAEKRLEWVSRYLENQHRGIRLLWKPPECEEAK